MTIQCMELMKTIRIKVEYTFGEIDLRWGILWRPLCFRLVQNIKVIDACLRLHNFIKKFEFGCNSCPAISDNTIFNEDSRRFFLHNTYSGLCGGEEDLCHNEDGTISLGGRPSSNDKQSSANGKQIRDNICEMIKTRQLERPKVNWFRCNNRTLDSI